MTYKILKDLSAYCTEKVDVSKLNLLTYISTENMLPNKAGITISTSLPNISTTLSFKKNDILVSNIRPYFKKIWRATFNGGCSNDVLVFRAKNGVCNQFLYYVLSDNNFFDFAMASSKGTKMPRGDKKILMEYPVPNFNLESQQKIAKVLSAIDDKIELNNAINNNLEQQAQAIFKQIFSDISEDDLPSNWHKGTIGEIIELHDSKRVPLSGQQREKMKQKIYPYYGATSLMDYVDDYIFDGIYLLLGEDGTVIDTKGFPILQYVWGKFWVNNHAHILTGKNGFNVESLYLLFRQLSIKSIVTGAVQSKISQTNLKSLEVIIPPIEVIANLNNKIKPLFYQIRSNLDENKVLTQLRDTLLPKLMSGEIDVSNVEI